jgi:acyl carrier protein
MKGNVPDIQQFIQHFTEQFEEPLEAKPLPETLLRNVEGWSSLQALIIVASFDWEYGVTVSSVELEQVKTIKNLYDLIVSKMAE